MCEANSVLCFGSIDAIPHSWLDIDGKEIAAQRRRCTMPEKRFELGPAAEALAYITSPITMGIVRRANR